MSVATHEYLPIQIQSLRVDSVLDFDLYFRTKDDTEPVLYRERHLPFAEQVRARLAESGVTTLLIRDDQERDYYRYMEDNVQQLPADDSISVEERTEILYGASTNMVREFFEDPQAADLVRRTETLVGATVDFWRTQNKTLGAFLKTVAFDYRTYTHSVNVAMYTLTLAQRAGESDPNALRDLAFAGFLHDIGKSRIPDTVLNKSGALSDDEWTIMKNHPVWGREILQAHGVDSPVVLAVTLSHHEKLDGSGYPHGISGDLLPRHVRMTTIADIFDALTTRRAYKDARDTFSVLQLMKKEMAHQLDPDLFEHFVRMLAA